MRITPRDLRTIGLAALAVAAAVFLGFEGWLDADRPVEFCSLVMTAALVAAAAKRQPAAERRGVMSPSFVVEIATLLLVGPLGAVLVALSGGLMKGRAAGSDRPEDVRRTIIGTVTAVAAIVAAGFLYRAAGGRVDTFVWPRQALPIAAAVATYLSVAIASTHFAVPLIQRRPFDRAWRTQLIHEAPAYFIGAGIAALFAELLDRRLWDVLPVAVIPLVLAYRMYEQYISRLEDEHLRVQIAAEAQQGLSVIDAAGTVMLWDSGAERLSGCARERAVGGLLAAVVPSLRDTPLPRAIADTLKDRTARSVASVSLTSAAGTRIVDVRVLPAEAGAALLWTDVTDRTQAERELKRTVERLTLAADGASEALWEWDLRTKEFYVSARWKAMLGLDPAVLIGRVEDWIGRVHPDDAAALNAAMRAHLAGETAYLDHRHRVRHEDGSYRCVRCSGLRGAGKRPSRIGGSLSDVTEHAAAQERLRTAGVLDPLTGLRNRADFVEALGRRLEEFKRRPASGRFAVLYLDLDRFKVVNDSLGHMVGDELLIAVARRLESCLRDNDCLGRLGGDEFAILLNAVNDDLQANAVAFRIQDALRAALSIAGRDVFTSASIGIAVGNAEYATPDEIMRDADAAMYHAKSNGKARHELFDSDMHARVRGRLSLENDLRRAVEANDFEVHYQPIVVLGTGMCVGFESLIRWTRSNGEKVSPATFIPMAEELGLIDRIGTWVLNQACLTFAEWQRRFPDAGLNCITVNASSRQLTQQNFPHLVEQALQKSHLRPQDLRIEVTETALMNTPHLAAEVLSQLRDFGVKIYLDDFGTGCSSLSHLHKLPVDALKVDRSFVMSLLMPERPAIVESILALARTLNTSVVAEGIEDEVQARELERLGCTHAQGYLFSRPLSTKQAEALIAANHPLGPKYDAELAARAYAAGALA